MNGRVTIADVARAAGVSSQTVSRTINDKPDVSVETRQRILRIIDELGYRPSRIARGLATDRTGNFGLVLPDVANPYFAEVVRGAEDVARKRGYSVFLCNSDEDPSRELAALHTLDAQHVDGIILASPRLPDHELRQQIPRLAPLVLVNHRLAPADSDPGTEPNVTVSAVLADDAAGAAAAVRHLWQRQHRCIGLLAGLATSHSSRRRREGYELALAELGLLLDPDLVVYGQPTVAGGREAALALLSAHPQVSALLAHNDLVATGALKACQHLRRQVPGDVAVVGFDDITLAAYVEPPLTTLRVPARVLGQEAMRILLEQLDEPGREREEILLEPRLIVRRSAP